MSQHYQPTNEHLKETIINFVTARAPYIVGTNHLPQKVKINKYIHRFFIVFGQNITLVCLSMLFLSEINIYAQDTTQHQSTGT